MANRALVSSGFVFNRSSANSCACLSAAKNAARSSGSGLRGYLTQKTFVVEEKLGGQDALPVALLEQISCRFRGASKGVFRVRLLPGLKLCASFLGLQFIEQVKAGIEFRHLQYRELRLAATRRERRNTESRCDQHAAEKPKYHWAGHGERAILTSFWQPDRRTLANDTRLYFRQSFPIG